MLDAKDGNDEKGEGSNIGIRFEALKTIDDIRDLVHQKCGNIVSCADITVLATREAVFLVSFFSLSSYIHFPVVFFYLKHSYQAYRDLCGRWF